MVMSRHSIYYIINGNIKQTLMGLCIMLQDMHLIDGDDILYNSFNNYMHASMYVSI